MLAFRDCTVWQCRPGNGFRPIATNLYPFYYKNGTNPRIVAHSWSRYSSQEKHPFSEREIGTEITLIDIV